MERRLRPGIDSASLKGIDLPLDYLKMVNEVFSTHFTAQLKALEKNKQKSRFAASGGIHADEVLLSVSLLQEGVVSATTVHASMDFDPTASSPTAEDLLGTCVDALASLYAQLIPMEEPENLLSFVEKPLGAFEKVPFDWAPVVVNKRKVFLKLDKSNPELEGVAEKWLKENDPKYEENLKAQQEEEEEFLAERVEAAKGPKRGDGGPIRH